MRLTQIRGGDVLTEAIDSVGDLVADHGVLGALLFLLIEEAGVVMPIPGDVAVMYAGSHVARGDLEWWTAWVSIILVVMAGSSFLFMLGRVFGRGLVRVGERWLHLNERNLSRGEQWFSRYGPLAIIFGRHIPGLRVPITVAAAIFKVRYSVFLASVAVSTAIWAGFFLFVGAALGPHARRLLIPHRKAYLFIALGIYGLGLAFILYRRYNRRLQDRRRRPR